MDSEDIYRQQLEKVIVAALKALDKAGYHQLPVSIVLSDALRIAIYREKQNKNF